MNFRIPTLLFAFSFCITAGAEVISTSVATYDRLIAETKTGVAEELQGLRVLTDESNSRPAGDITGIACTNGSVFKPRADGCFVASGPNPEHEVLTLTLEPARAGKVLRFDFPLDNNLPGGGPGRTGNGNFAISEIEIEGMRAVAAWATAAEAPCYEWLAIDGISDDAENCWNALAFRHRPRTLLVALDKTALAGAPLTVRLICKSKWGEHVPGCITTAVLADESIAAALPAVSEAERELVRLEQLKLFALAHSYVGAAAPADRSAVLQPKSGDKIVAIGDSITAAGGYLRRIDEILSERYPDLELPKIINKGIGGQKAEDLLRRFDRDVIQLKPAFVTICVGINDVWHRLQNPHNDDVLAAYKRNVGQMVDAAHAAGIKVILLTPTIIEEDPDSEGNKRLAKYVAAEKEIAAEKKCTLVDLHGMFLAALETRTEEQRRGRWLTGDGIHMSPLGDTLMAAGVLGALGVSPVPAERAFSNTLGMEFVPVKAVPGVLFCRWETRVRDFGAFCEASDRVHEAPDFAQGDDHPVVYISYNDAMEFCAWLSEKEGKKYRLPSDHEWSGAVGIGDKEDASFFPKVKGIEAPREKRAAIRGVYPWGPEWPPPAGSGNFDSALNVDAYDRTSPVGAFPPTADGLHDLAGNVWEWCDSIYEPREHYRVMRGGSWRHSNPMFLSSAFRGRGNTPTRHDIRGFRVVLEVGDGGGQKLLRRTSVRPRRNPPAAGESRLVANLRKGKAQTVVTYGTSLTSGGAWVTQLGAALEATWPRLITVVNSGAGGMWSKWGVENLEPRVLEKKPDTLLIEFGINDAFLKYETSVEEARANLNNMIDRVLAAKADTEIVLMTMNPPVGGHLARRPAIAEYYEMYRAVAEERDLMLIDHDLNWQPILANDRALFDGYVPDGIHPGAEGCEMVITPALLKALGAPRMAAPDAIKVLLVGGRGSHDWHGFHDTIAPVLEAAGDFELALTPNIDEIFRANLDQHDVVLFYGPGGNFTRKRQEQALHDYVTNGGGLVGVHATDAFKQSDVYWRLLGGRFTTHRGGEFMIRIMDKNHPVTAPFTDFKIHDETYANEYHPDFELHSLFRMDRGEEQQSMGWVQNYGKGRVFNTTLGHDHKAWRNEHFQKIVLRGIYWAAGRELKDATEWPPTSDPSKDSTINGRVMETFQHGVKPEWGYTVPQKDAFVVIHPKTDRENAPLYVVLHSAGHDVFSAVNCTKTIGNHDIYRSPDDHFALYLDCRKNKENDWWWGGMHRGDKGLVAKNSGGDTVPVEKRVMDTVAWAIERYKIDPNRVYLSGNSMGGSGALGIGMRHGDVFAAIKANVPAGVEHVSERMFFPPKSVPEGVTLPDPPICIDYSGQNDGWSAGHDHFARAMNHRKYPLFFYWGPFGHGNNSAKILAVNDLVDSFDWLSVKKNEAYPAFTNASTNSKLPWPDDLKSADPGQINAFFRWKTQRDTAREVEMSLFLISTESLQTKFEIPKEARADVTLRRLQNLSLEPGAPFHWDFGQAQGEGAADAQGLITIAGLTITSVPATLRILPGGKQKATAAHEPDPRLQAEGRGWRLDRAKITDPERPRVLLIGDSILNGYFKSVVAALNGKAHVDAWVNPHWQSEGTNKLLADVLDNNGPYDVVHFNMGLHGWTEGRIKDGTFEPLTEAYVEVLKTKLPKAKLIWASSTPVTAKDNTAELEPEINPIIVEHNRMAAVVMAKAGVPVNDFYALLEKKRDLAKGDRFYWTGLAYKLLGEKVVESILRELAAELAAASDLKSGEYFVTQTWSQEEGFRRPYLVQVPEGDGSQPLPVIVFLHGNGGSAKRSQKWFGKRYPEVSRKFITVFAEGYRKSWNIVSEKSKADDRGFVEAIVEELAKHGNVSENEFSIMGVSNGAALANQIVIETKVPNIKNYVTSVSPLNTFQHDGRHFKAKGNGNDYDTLAEPLVGKRLLNISGTNDRLVPYTGGPSPAIPAKGGKLPFVDAEESIFLWAKRMGHEGDKLAGSSELKGKIEVFSYLDGDVVHLKAVGYGHNATEALGEDLLLEFLRGRRAE